MKNWIDNLIDSKGNWLVAEEAIANLKRSAPNLYNEVMDEIRIRGAIDDATLETKEDLEIFEAVGDREIDITDKEITPNITTPNNASSLNDGDKRVLDKYGNMLVKKGRQIMKSYNGIIDKDVWLRDMDNVISTSNFWQERNVFKREFGTVRELSLTVFNILTATEVLEWRNLMMTRKGYTRLVRMFSEFFAERMAGNFFGTPLNIGCTYPRGWDRF